MRVKIDDPGLTARGATVQALFDAKASTWGRKYAPSGPLLARITAFRDALGGRVPPPARVLELGCGNGDLASALHERGYQLDACDFSSQMLEAARAAFSQAGIEWHLLPVDWRRLPFEDGTFQAVVASSVLEYVDDAGAVLGELARVVVPDGLLLFTVPDVEHSTRRIEHWLARLTRIPPLARLASLSRRAAQYVRYLEVSRNRWTYDQWIEKARGVGFAPVQPVSRGGQPLMMVIVRRNG